ncbi:MAG TPA: chemotaxis protein CheX [Verrucomicrobiae bacterium]|jgi:CheY-specific phosphatase CheX|nr:chemotaxis protein CheX [Verrucomicrobiae bacterium]
MAAAPDINQYKELARRYGIAAAPESVLHLTQLVARQDCCTDEIVRVIEKDPGLSARLLRVANPGAADESEYNVGTVDEALMRNGIGCALLLAMGTPLSLALTKTFQTMLSLKLESVDVHQLDSLEGQHMRCSIGFAGKVTGRVYLRMSSASAKAIAAGILGLDAAELGNDETRDAAGELLNIMTGNFKSNLCDAGLDCKLHPPKVGMTEDFSTPVEPGGGLERLAFRAGAIQIFVDVTANPWSD